MSGQGAPLAAAPADLRAAAAATAPVALVTRPDPAGARLARQLAAEGWRPLAAPVMRFEQLEASADPLDAQAVALTSANGARGAPPASAPGGSALRALPCFCVGEATAEAAREAGFADVRAGEADAAALAGLIAAQAPAGAGILHLRGRHGDDALAQALSARGFQARQAVVYAMIPAERLPEDADAALAAGRVRMIPVFSPRSGGILARLLERRHDLSRTVAVAISRAAADPLLELGFARVDIAAAPTRAAMRAAMDEVAKAARRRAARSAQAPGAPRREA